MICAAGLLESAVIQTVLPTGDGCRVDVVRYHEQRCIELSVESLQQVHDLLGSVGIQVSCRFVSNHNLGIGDNRSSDSGSLLLPTGQLPRVMIGSIEKIDRLQCDLDSFMTLGACHGQQQQRHLDVLKRCQYGDQIVCLEM